MTKERNRAVPAVYLLLREGRHVLLMRRQNTGYYDGWYSVPAGHVEAGELPADGLIRETAEELGIVIDPGDVKLVYVMYRTKHDETGDRLDLFFSVSKWSGQITNAEPHKCDDIQWFKIDSLPENMMHHVKSAVMNIEKSKLYSQLGLDHVLPNPNNTSK